MEKETKELQLIKKSDSYKIIIPDNVERLIRFLCERVWDTEWSGVLFYTPSGQFEDGSLEIRCVDILPMDVGSATYTEFDMSPDVISYMAQNPELLDCKMGLIHSHNNMSTFFSGTDTATLKEEGADRNHFVSLIVNNAGNYTAAITRKIKYKSIREISYEGFEGTVNIKDKEKTEGEEIEYFNLDIVFESASNNKFSEVAARLAEIKKTKASKYPSYNSSSAGTNLYNNTPKEDNKFPYFGYLNKDDDFKSKKTAYQSTLFDDDEFARTPKVTKSAATTTPSPAEKVVTDEVISSIITQLITGSVTITKLDKDIYDKAVTTFNSRFSRRFHNDRKLFKYWADEFVDFLLWYTIDDPNVDDCEVAALISDKCVEKLKSLPNNMYIEVYSEAFRSYVNNI